MPGLRDSNTLFGNSRVMTLTAHSIVGGAIVSLMPAYPVLGLCLAFASHFILDAIPHWDYPVRSASLKPDIATRMRYDRALLKDLITIGTDATLGVALASLLFAPQGHLLLVASGACAALLPDALQFAYMRYPRGPLLLLQRFHWWIHTPVQIERPILGIGLQVAFIAAVVITVRSGAP